MKFMTALLFVPSLMALSAPAAGPERVRLANGDLLTVEVVEATADHVTFTHSVFGTVTVPRDRIEMLGPVEAVAATATAPASEPAAAAEAPASGAAAAAPAAAPVAAEPAAPPREWKFNFTLAGAGAAGNTENASLNTRFTAAREVETNRTLLDATYFYGSKDGDKSDNRFSGGIRNDFLFPGKRYFLFASGRYDYDEFNSWLHRVTGHGGVGYRFIEPPKLALTGLLGMGAIKEWKSQNDSVRPEGMIGIEGQYDFAENHAITFRSTYFPDLSDFDPYSYRWVNGAGWSWRIDRDNGLSLTAGFEHEYQDRVDPGRDRNDFRAFAGVDWEF